MLLTIQDLPGHFKLFKSDRVTLDDHGIVALYSHLWCNAGYWHPLAAYVTVPENAPSSSQLAQQGHPCSTPAQQSSSTGSSSTYPQIMAEEEHQVHDADFDGLDEGMEGMGAEDGEAHGEGIDVSATAVLAASSLRSAFSFLYSYAAP